MGRGRWLLGIATASAALLLALSAGGGLDRFGRTAAGPDGALPLDGEGQRPGRLGPEAIGTAGADGAGTDEADEPAPLAPVAPDLRGPTAAAEEPADAGTDTPKRFKLKVGESLPLTDAQKAALARAKREAAIAKRRRLRAKLAGPAGERDRLAQVEHDTISRDDVPDADAAALDGVFELEDETEPETAEGVTTAIEGRVLDRDTGAPIAGARVALFSSFYKPHLTYDRHLSELGGGTTDAEGRFRFAAVNLDALHYRGGAGVLLVIQHRNYASWSNAPPKPITEGTVNTLGDLILVPSGLSIGGRILNRDGSPLPDMLVAISPENPLSVSKPQRQILLKSMPHARTDGDGRYRIEGLTPGKVWITVHANLDGVLFQEITIGTTRDDVNFTVRVGGAVTGRIVDRNGRPIAAARIDGSGNTTHSLADGTYLLENLNERTKPFRLTVHHHAYYPRDVDGVRDGQLGLEVALDLLPVATLVVREGDTFTPLTEIEVLYNASAAVRATIPTSPYRTNAQGEYHVILYPKAASIRVFKQGYKEQTLALSELAGGTRREVVLERLP
jgi:protocatechuate 3,4-dioxygenase beta subunit